MYKGDYSKARDTYKTMYFEAPDDNGRDLALVAMINSYIAERDIDKAIETNKRRQAAAMLNDDAGSLIGIHDLAGFIQLEAGRLDKAAKSFAKADEYRKDPSLPAASHANRIFAGMVSNTRLLIARKQFDAAKAELEKIRHDVEARKNVNRERTYNELEGHLALAQENFSKAVESFSKANPADPYVWYYKALALERAGDKTTAADLRSKVTHWNSLHNPGFAIVNSRIESQMSSRVN